MEEYQVCCYGQNKNGWFCSVNNCCCNIIQCSHKFGLEFVGCFPVVWYWKYDNKIEWFCLGYCYSKEYSNNKKIITNKCCNILVYNYTKNINGNSK